MSERSTTAIWDVGFFGDPDIVALEDQFGRAAGADFMRIVLLLYQKGGELRKGDAIAILKRSGCEDPEEFIAACVDRELFSLSDGFLSSDRVNRELLALEKKRQAWRERQEKSRESRSGHQTVTRVSRECHASVTQECERDSKEEEETETDPEPERETEPEEKTDPEPDPTPEIYELEAEKRLEKPGGGKPWERSPAFMAAGRRPLKKYPEIMLTVFELAHIFREWEGVEFELADIDAGFRTCLARLKSKATAGQRMDTTCCYAWMTGWVLHEAVEKKTKVNRLKKSEVRHGANVN